MLWVGGAVAVKFLKILKILPPRFENVEFCGIRRFGGEASEDDQGDHF